MKHVYIKTYGCQMNVHESEKLYLAFEKQGFAECGNMEDADVVVLNTCAVRENAETHVYGNLGIVKKIKEKNPGLVVAVIGCMSQQDGMAEYIKKRCPFVNVILGTTGFSRLPEIVVKTGPKGFYKDTVIDESVPGGVNYAKRTGRSCFVNITYGCNNFCTYCIVPYVKGRERSRKLRDVVDEVRGLVESGYKEITLLGQNVNSYNDGEHNFRDLLDAVSDIEGEYWIKFMTSHPKDISEEVIKLIAEKDRLAKFIHFPLQSGSDRILAAMNRKYTLKEYLEKIETIRKYIPSCGISGDIIVGFPGETEEDFTETLEAVGRIKYNNLFMFIYSKRTGTPAAEMDCQVDEDVKKERIKRLIAVQSESAESIALSAVGQTEKVLCDSCEKGICTGKTTADKVIVFSGCPEYVNKFLNVKITSSRNSKLYGEVED